MTLEELKKYMADRGHSSEYKFDNGYPLKNRSATSLILDEEEEYAKQFVFLTYKKKYIDYIENSKKVYNDTDGFDTYRLPIPIGRMISIGLVVDEKNFGIFVNDKGQKVAILRPESMSADDHFKNCTGVVVAIGPDAYSDDKWFKSGPYCKVGDYVALPRHAGFLVNHRGMPFFDVKEDSPFQILQSPEHVKLY